MDRQLIVIVENEEVSFNVEYYLLKCGKGQFGIEAVKKEHGQWMETEMVSLADHNADEVVEYIRRLAHAFVTPALLKEILTDMIFSDLLKKNVPCDFKFPIFS